MLLILFFEIIRVPKNLSSSGLINFYTGIDLFNGSILSNSDQFSIGLGPRGGLKKSQTLIVFVRVGRSFYKSEPGPGPVWPLAIRPAGQL